MKNSGYSEQSRDQQSERDCRTSQPPPLVAELWALGFQAIAHLLDRTGSALAATLVSDQFAPPADLHVQFLASDYGNVCNRGGADELHKPVERADASTGHERVPLRS